MLPETLDPVPCMKSKGTEPSQKGPLKNQNFVLYSKVFKQQSELGPCQTPFVDGLPFHCWAKGFHGPGTADPTSQVGAFR